MLLEIEDGVYFLTSVAHLEELQGMENALGRARGVGVGRHVRFRPYNFLEQMALRDQDQPAYWEAHRRGVLEGPMAARIQEGVQRGFMEASWCTI